MLRKTRDTSDALRRYRGALAVTAVAGGAAAAGQVGLIRELLTLFAGFELASGLLFASWLFWGAVGSLGFSKLLTGRPLWARESLLSLLLACSGLTLPVSVLLARSARHLWAVPLGVQPGMDVMIRICLLLPGVFCIPCGGVFAIAWGVARRTRPSSVIGQPLSVYLADALGAGIGGVMAYAGLLLGADALTISLLLCWACALASALISARGSGGHRITGIMAGVLGFSLPLLLPAMGSEGALGQWSRRVQWGDDFMAACETPCQSLALTGRHGEYTLFGGGVWMYTLPDPLSVEWSVHPAMLMHPAPKYVLLLGGNPRTQPAEILRHPSVEQVVSITRDKGQDVFVQEHIPSELLRGEDGSRVQILSDDPMRCLRLWPDADFDVVLLNMGDPVNASLSRYYSREFFTVLARLMRPDGLVVFSAQASPEALGPAQEAWIRSLWSTARTVFPEVRVLLGEQALFLAGKQPLPDPGARKLMVRAGERGLHLVHVREDTLNELLNPFKRDYVRGVLEQPGALPVNTVLRPVCYFNSLVLWAGDFGPWVKSLLLSAPTVGKVWLWICAGALAASLALVKRPESCIRLMAATSGGGELVLQLSMVLAFQSLAGSLYGQLALLVGAYMAGLGLGAWLVARCQGKWRRQGKMARWFVRAHLILAGALILAGPLFQILFHLPPEVSLFSLPVLFTALALGTGFLGGGHFSLAVSCLGELLPEGDHGAPLYGVDLLGASIASLAASLFLLPVYGLSATCVAMALLLLGSGVGLMRKNCLNIGNFPQSR